MRDGGLTLVECYCYLRNVQDLLSDGQTPYKKRFGEPFKGPIIPFGALAEYHLISARDQMRIHQFGKKVLPGIFEGYALIAEGLWKGDILRADMEEFENMDASEIYPRRINAKEVLIRHKRGWIHIPICRWHSKIVRRWLRIPRTHSKAGTSRKERKISEENFKANWKNLNLQNKKRWRGSPYRLLVDSRWLHLSSSQWTSSSTPCAERRNFLHSTEIYWCDQIRAHWFGGQTREAYWRLLECWLEPKSVRHMERFYEIYSIERKTSHAIHVVRGGDWQEFKRLQDQITCGLRYGPKLEKPLRIEKKQEWAVDKPKLDNARQNFIDPRDEEYQETMKNARKKLEIPMAPAMPNKEEYKWTVTVSGNGNESHLHLKKFRKRSVVVKWNLMSPQDQEGNRLNLNIMKIILQAKEFTSMNHHNLVHKLIPMPQAINEARRRLFLKHKETKRKSTLPH